VPLGGADTSHLVTSSATRANSRRATSEVGEPFFSAYTSCLHEAAYVISVRVSRLVALVPPEAAGRGSFA